MNLLRKKKRTTDIELPNESGRRDPRLPAPKKGVTRPGIGGAIENARKLRSTLRGRSMTRKR